jgi:hypothetical protein
VISGEPVVTTVCFLPTAHGLRVHRAPGIPCALIFREGRHSIQTSGTLRRETVDGCLRGGSSCRRWRDRTATELGGRWLPLRHDCCVDATVLQDLTVNTASSCLRRFLATPLHEIILRRLTATALAKAKENPAFWDWIFWDRQGLAEETGSRWTPRLTRPTSRRDCRAVT